MRFADRLEAARRLAAALERHRGENPLVLAIPRGGVPMGAEIARTLGGELDVVLVKKLRAPWSPELAVGAVDETGRAHFAAHAAAAGATPAYLEEERQRQLAALRAQRRRFTPRRAPIDPAGRVAIVLDDGLATGATMIAALNSVRARRPSRLVCAVPVAAAESLESVRTHCDEVVCLHVPADFGAVGAFYRDFRQVEDDEVLAALEASAQQPTGEPSS